MPEIRRPTAYKKNLRDIYGINGATRSYLPGYSPIPKASK